MWVKWLSAVVIICVISIMVIEHEDEDTVQQVQTEPFQRSAQQIIMHELKTDSDVSTTIKAGKVVELPDSIITLDDFEVSQSGGLHMTGLRARYDTKNSILTVSGPLSINIHDGTTARLDGLVWNRTTQTASTKNPVVVHGISGVIESEQAEFHNNFANISFLGGVHAKISENYLYN